jgi:hypothetical protein
MMTHKMYVATGLMRVKLNIDCLGKLTHYISTRGDFIDGTICDCCEYYEN